MEQLTTAIILQVVGIALLVLEIFIPSHGVLSLTGLGCLVAGLYAAFGVSATAGYVSFFMAMLLVPAIAVVAVKVFHRTPFGRLISPPNPRLTEADVSFDVADIQPLVGSVGRTVTPLRPVGTCEFDGRRVECVAEMGLIEANQPVRAVRVDGRELVVALCKEE